MKLKVAGGQLGPYAGTRMKQEQAIRALSQGLVADHKPDLLILPELISGPYFALEKNPAWLDTAESIPGPTSQLLAELATESQCHVTGSFFHRAEDGRYLNTALLARPDGSFDTPYSKTHIPNIHHGTTRGLEAFYFSGGDGFVVWDVKGVQVGILICYDRSFPEAWREVRLAGADVIIVLASSSGFRSAMFVQELQVRAMENGVWVVAVNKGGNETCIDAENPADFYGSSCVIGPDGEVRLALDRQPDVGFGAEIDVAEALQARERLDYYATRRPDLYRQIAKPVA